jgi:FG-GAP-like repeat
MLGFSRSHKSDTPRRPVSILGGPLERLEERDTPAIIANADFYTARAGTVLTVAVPNGVLANDFSDTSPGSVLTATLSVRAKYQNSAIPLPSGSLIFNPNGSFTFITPNQDLIPNNAGPVIFTYSASSTTGEPIAQALVTITIQSPKSNYVVTGADAGGGPHVRVYQAGTGTLKFNFFPYETTFTGGVRVAVGDVNNDGIDDIITMPATGGSARLRVYDGKDGANILDTILFDPAFRGGGYVAVGDYNGDGRKDIIAGAGEGGGPRVTVLTLGANNAQSLLADFFAYTPDVQTGVRVAAGDLYGIGRDNLITAPGVGGGPQVNVFDGVRNRGRNVTSPLYSFFAGDSANRDGVNISTGNLRGDGKFDILTGSGAGAGVVSQFDGRSAGLIRQIAVSNGTTPTGTGVASGPGTFNLSFGASGSLLGPTTAPVSLTPSVTTGNSFTGAIQGGVRVAAIDWNGDGLDDIVAADGAGNSPRVQIYNTQDRTVLTTIVPYSTGFFGGVNVAASPLNTQNIAQPA